MKPGFDTAFMYSDAWVEDSRLVALNALDAAERGADIRVRTKLVRARRDGDGWRATLETAAGAATEVVPASSSTRRGPGSPTSSTCSGSTRRRACAS